MLLPTIRISISWIVLYLIVAGLLIFLEYHATTMPIFKRNFRYVLLSYASISMLYLLYASKDPAQIYNMFISEYIRLGITSYISPTLPAVGWIALGLCTVFFVILGSYNTVRYVQIAYDDTRQDMILKRKFDAAGTGVSVFVHGGKEPAPVQPGASQEAVPGFGRGPSGHGAGARLRRSAQRAERGNAAEDGRALPHGQEQLHCPHGRAGGGAGGGGGGAVSRQVPRPAGSPGCGHRPIGAGGSQPPERGGVQPAVQWV